MAKKKVSSIYKIVNVNTDKVYVGSAVDTHVRWLKHKRELIQGKHHSNKLQRAFDKYGVDSFIYEIIEICDSVDLLIKEEEYIKHYDSYNNGYNCTINTEAPMKGRKHSEKTKNKMSKLKLGTNLSEEHKKNISKAMKGIVRGEYSEEHRKSISESLKGYKHSEETKEKISKTKKGKTIHTEKYKSELSVKMSGKNNPFYGKKHSEEFKVKKMKPILEYDLQGNFIREWISLSECAKVLGIRVSGISSVLSGRYKHTNNRVFKYKKVNE